MKRYQIVLLLAVACVPLGLALYKRSYVVDVPTVVGATYSMAGDPKSGLDLHVKVYGVKPDSCFEGSRAKVRYDEKSGTISIVPQLTKSRLSASNCQPNAPGVWEGVLKKVPEGTYTLMVRGKGRAFQADVSLPHQGAIPEGFVATDTGKAP